jgi:hypothetical protein
MIFFFSIITKKRRGEQDYKSKKAVQLQGIIHRSCGQQPI